MRKISNLLLGSSLLLVLLISSCGDSGLTIVDQDAPVQTAEDSLAQLAEDNALIDAYIAENRLEDVFTTSSGVRYYLIEEGNGTFPELNDIVSVSFIGYYLDGTVFDTNIESVADNNIIGKDNGDFSVWRFNYTVDGRQLGFNGQYSYLTLMPELKRGMGAAMGLMDEGSRAMVILPSNHALGPFGFDNNSGFAIPEHTVLLFEFRMVQVRTN